MTPPFEQEIGIDAVFLRELRYRYAGIAGRLGQPQLQLFRMIRPGLRSIRGM